MICPNCKNKLTDNSVKCKYCEKKLYFYNNGNKLRVESSFTHIKRLLILFFRKGKNRETSPWSFIDIAFLSVLVYFFIHKDFFGFGYDIVRFLRKDFIIFTQDKHLLFQMAICVNTILLKILCLLSVFILTVIRKKQINKVLISSGELPANWGSWMLPLYISVCFILRAFVLNGPLMANMPFNSVFPQAKIIGNILLVFSIIIVAPFVEEVIFRGFLYPAVNRYMGVYPAIITTSLLFTAAHFPQIRFDYMFIIILFSLSAVITFTRAVTGSTRIAIMMHAVYNAIAIGIGWIDYTVFHF